MELKKGQVQIVKKNYKGKMELLKKHQDIPSYYEQNCYLQFDEKNQVDQIVASIVKRSKDTQLAYLKLEKVENLEYKFGAEKAFNTEFLFLNKNKEDENDFKISD